MRGTGSQAPFETYRFKDKLSIRARRLEHSGGMECNGVVIGLRRIARKTGWHSHRGVFLVDAQAGQHALKKGRSSAPSFHRPVRQAGAITLAADWLLRYGYIPSESMPADRPSRGKGPLARRRRQRADRLEPMLAKHATQRRREVRVSDPCYWPRPTGTSISTATSQSSHHASSSRTPFCS